MSASAMLLTRLLSRRDLVWSCRDGERGPVSGCLPDDGFEMRWDSVPAVHPLERHEQRAVADDDIPNANKQWWGLAEHVGGL
ncbi:MULTISPECIES: hypothetical protein [Rhodopseudomonas]|uniref:hypothetical protein n=1 Tax=Rhodopseudomonas TaxID=1073 RepID=UPI0011C07746|nr:MULTISPECIES: hypothetical protein [Rhodopseudomonas]